MASKSFSNPDLLFEHISPDEHNLIIQFTELIKLKKGQYLFYENTTGECIYLIKSGKIIIEKKGHFSSHLLASNYFVELSVLDNTPRTSAVYANELSVLQKFNLLALQAQYPKIYVKLIDNISKLSPDRLQRTDEAIANRKKEVEQHINIGCFSIYVLSLLVLFIFVFRFIALIYHTGEIVPKLNIRVTLVLTLIFFLVMWKKGYQLDSMGLTYS